MSLVKISGNASGTGTLTIAAPNTNTDYTLTLPQATGTLITTAGGAAISGTTGAFTSTVGVGGATPAASGAGITFPATQSASSDANTLDDYEEGTWTPNQGGGLTVVGTFSSTGRYTKIGRIVSVQGTLSGTTSVAVGNNGVMSSNLPFSTSGGDASGIATNNANSASIGLVASTATIYSSGSMSATPTIFFNCTYTAST